MAIVVDQVQAQVSEPPPERPAAASPAAKPLDRDTLVRLLRLAAARRARLFAD
jgi:hypothetical protein